MYPRKPLVAIATLIFCASAVAAPAGKPFVTVNGKPVPQNLADLFVQEQIAQGNADSPQLREAVKEELIKREAVVQAARAKGIDKRPEVEARASFASQGVVIDAFIQDYLRNNPISEETQKAEYEKIKGAMTAKEYKARHILVEAEADAQAIIAKLDGGAKFSDLAKDSKDPGSKDNGGDLGWNQAGAYVKPFADALVALGKGSYTKAPVRTQFGYHVILAEDNRMSDPPPFERIQEQLTQHLQQQQIAKLINEIRQKAKVK